MSDDRHYNHILLVEDHSGDVTLTQKAFLKVEMPIIVHVAVDGFEAMSFLRREGPRFATVPRPDLILLDLNMPRRDGRSVLREVKADPSLRLIPVVVLTTSSAAVDVRMAHDLHANAYVSKPVGFADFVATIGSIAHFWLGVVQRPSPP